MPNGTVKFFNAAKGFGFITPDEGDKDVFVPAASVTSAGVSKLKPGQRVSFTSQPDGKGPKAVDLVLLAEVRPAKTVEAPPPQPSKAKLTFYHDPSWDRSLEALAEIYAAGYEPRIVEYLATPPSRDELKRLSMLLRDSDQSLVRRYDSLFMELRLDDRFISENEFWDAIVEHPTLINGPIVATATKARVCQSETAVKSFLSLLSSDMPPMPAKPKGLSERALRMLVGDVAVPPAVREAPLVQTAPVKTSVPEDDGGKARKPAPSKRKKATGTAKPKAPAKETAKAVSESRKPAKKVPAKAAAPKRAQKAAKKKA